MRAAQYLQPRDDDRNQQAKENALIEDFDCAALSRKHTIAKEQDDHGCFHDFAVWVAGTALELTVLNAEIAVFEVADEKEEPRGMGRSSLASG